MCSDVCSTLTQSTEYKTVCLPACLGVDSEQSNNGVHGDSNVFVWYVFVWYVFVSSV